MATILGRKSLRERAIRAAEEAIASPETVRDEAAVNASLLFRGMLEQMTGYEVETIIYDDKWTLRFEGLTFRLFWFDYPRTAKVQVLGQCPSVKRESLCDIGATLAELGLAINKVESQCFACANK